MVDHGSMLQKAYGGRLCIQPREHLAHIVGRQIGLEDACEWVTSAVFGASHSFATRLGNRARSPIILSAKLKWPREFTFAIRNNASSDDAPAATHLFLISNFDSRSCHLLSPPLNLEAQAGWQWPSGDSMMETTRAHTALTMPYQRMPRIPLAHTAMPRSVLDRWYEQSRPHYRIPADRGPYAVGGIGRSRRGPPDRAARGICPAGYSISGAPGPRYAASAPTGARGLTTPRTRD